MNIKHLCVAAISFVALTATAQNNDTLAKATASKSIVMGVRESSPPLSYLVGSSKYVGYHVEICERILGSLLPNAAIKYMPITPQNRIPLLQNGTIDIECGSTSNTAARQQQVAFAYTTYLTEVRIAVKAASGIERVDQLQGKTVVTTAGSTHVQRLRGLERKGLEFKLLTAKDHAESFLLLETDRADAYVMDDNTLAGVIANSRYSKDYRLVAAPLGVEPMGITLRKDDEKFKKAVDGEIKKLMASGELEKLYQKWFLQPIAPNGAVLGIPMSASLKSAIKEPTDKPAEAYQRE